VAGRQACKLKQKPVTVSGANKASIQRRACKSKESMQGQRKRPKKAPPQPHEALRHGLKVTKEKRQQQGARAMSYVHACMLRLS